MFPDIIKNELPEEIHEKFNAYLKMRRKKGKSIKTTDGLTARIKELKTLSDNNVEKMNLIIQQSIDNEWLKFIQLKTENKEPRKTNYNPFTALREREEAMKKERAVPNYNPFTALREKEEAMKKEQTVPSYNPFTALREKEEAMKKEQTAPSYNPFTEIRERTERGEE